MGKIENVEIGSSLFGGYNKKDTDWIISQFQTTVAELEDTVSKLRKENDRHLEELEETKTSYRELCEQCKEQERRLERQEELLRTRQDNIRKLEKEKAREKEQFLGELEKIIVKKDIIIAELKSEVEKRQWLYDELFKNRRRVQKIPVLDRLSKAVRKNRNK